MMHIAHGSVIFQVGEHNHVPRTAEIEALRALCNIRKEAASHDY